MIKFWSLERWVLLLTLVFLLSTVGWFFYQNQQHELTRISVAHIEKENTTSAIKTSEEAPGILEGEQININKAPIEDLIRLPGIGSVRAEHIVAYREANGPFQTIEDIMQVSGIGEKTFEKLSEYITVNE
ncbi:MAG: Late competence protein ComEA, receptor [Evtepia sp.]|jgi:competence protein ComEA|nr:Late competence protein ComEA, receptor [Evtepia sp.]